MNITFGKHNGKSLELLILREPDYVLWILEQVNVAGPLAMIQTETKRLIAIFDKKYFQKKCFGCGNSATYCAAYMTNLQNLSWWCDQCDPYQSGTVSGKLHIFRTYYDVIKNVRPFSEDRKSDLKSIIKTMLEAKGLSNTLSINGGH